MENRPAAPALSVFLLVVFVFVISAKVMTFAFSRTDTARDPASFNSENRGVALDSADYASVLSDRARFSKFVQHWRVECFDHPILQKDPFFGVRLKDFAEDTLFNGLVKLKDLNPSVVRQALSRIQTPLILDCKNFDRDSGLLSVIFGKPRVVGRFLEIPGAPEAIACGFGAYCRNEPQSVDGLRNPMFQELLQVFGVDDVKHQKIAAEEGISHLVSACASTVFPSGYFPVGDFLLESGVHVARLASAEGCRVCVTAKVKSHGKSSDINDLQISKRADELCSGVQVLASPAAPAA